jgi:hypothetical protein
MKQHEKKPPQDEVTPLQKEVCEKIEYQSTLDVVALENEVISEINEYERILELGRVIWKIITEENIMKASLSKGFAEALELFEKHGQVKDVKPVVWRP